MSSTFDPRDAARFLRTLRVATQTVIALDDLGSAYAQRTVKVRLGEALLFDGVFDRDGALHVVLDAEALARADLSRLEIELLDAEP